MRKPITTPDDVILKGVTRVKNCGLIIEDRYDTVFGPSPPPAVALHQLTHYAKSHIDCGPTGLREGLLDDWRQPLLQPLPAVRGLHTHQKYVVCQVDPPRGAQPGIKVRRRHCILQARQDRTPNCLCFHDSLPAPKRLPPPH